MTLTLPPTQAFTLVAKYQQIFHSHMDPPLREADDKCIRGFPLTQTGGNNRIHCANVKKKLDIHVALFES